MNKLIGFNLASNLQDVVNLKVYGSHTELLVDRQAEIDTMIVSSADKITNMKTKNDTLLHMTKSIFLSNYFGRLVAASA